MNRLLNFLPRSTRKRVLSAIPKWICPAQMVFSLVLVVLSVAITLLVVHEDPPKDEAQEEPVPVALVAVPEQVEEEKREPTDAEYVAKVLYGMRANSEADLTCVAWVIVNRVESTLYPNTVKEVCQQPQQWVGYYDNNPIVDEFYRIAADVLKSWKQDGHRPFTPDFLYFNWSQSNIEFRTDFESGPKCKYYDN